MFDLGGMNIDVSVEMGSVKGERGWYYEPHMTEDGTLTWTNNGGLENPQTVNIRGPVGKGFQIKATFATLEELEAVTDAESGDFFNVGTEAPYTIYLYDGKDFVSQGQLQGPTGAPGEKGDTGKTGDPGVTFTPQITNGVMSWTNDGGRENPAPVDLTSELKLVDKVDKEEGKQLSTNDYTTEEKNKLAGVEASANKYVHPETHPASMIVDIPAAAGTGALPMFKGSDGKMGTLDAVAARGILGAVSSYKLQLSLPVSGWSATEPSTQTVSAAHVTADCVVQVAPGAGSDEAYAAWGAAAVRCSAQAEGSLTFTASSVPETDLIANVLVMEGVSG